MSEAGSQGSSPARTWGLRRADGQEKENRVHRHLMLRVDLGPVVQSRSRRETLLLKGRAPSLLRCLSPERALPLSGQPESDWGADFVSERGTLPSLGLSASWVGPDASCSVGLQAVLEGVCQVGMSQSCFSLPRGERGVGVGGAGQDRWLGHRKQPSKWTRVALRATQQPGWLFSMPLLGGVAVPGRVCPILFISLPGGQRCLL